MYSIIAHLITRNNLVKDTLGFTCYPNLPLPPVITARLRCRPHFPVTRPPPLQSKVPPVAFCPPLFVLCSLFSISLQLQSLFSVVRAHLAPGPWASPWWRARAADLGKLSNDIRAPCCMGRALVGSMIKLQPNINANVPNLVLTNAIIVNTHWHARVLLPF